MNHLSIPVKSFNVDLSGLLIFYDFDLTSRVLLNLGTLTSGVVVTQIFTFLNFFGLSLSVYFDLW